MKIDQITVPCKAISELGASAAVLLAFLCELHRKHERKNELLERDFFACTRQELTNAIGMLRRQQENAISELSNLKYIRVKANQPGFNGGVRLFKINKEILIELGYFTGSSVSDVHKRIAPLDEVKVKKKQKITQEGLDLFSSFGEDDIPQPAPEMIPVEVVSVEETPNDFNEEQSKISNKISDFVSKIFGNETPKEQSEVPHKENSADTSQSAFFDDHNWITNSSNIIYHPQSQMQQQLVEKIANILSKDIDLYSKCSDLLTILGIRSQLEYFDMHQLSKCGDLKIQETIDTLLNFAKIAPTLSPILLKFHQAILVEIIKFIIKGHDRSILSFEYRTESLQPKKELQKILVEHYIAYQFNINIV